ncbi:putative dna-dependent rna polymerase i subunit a43 protein [Neofusicoccum parvum UCRNP2]|uniref:DNA-directed RNA polymerase subunit n=1 Tax=Botryosphaeria parva (strain UCR-NP2) TaxID=1287680 RepID=R1EJW2_BOTPV|nr:putative dna-dependent rna polymerase i subunit a43 protein [Neofusicoccum parvum UCRNP2]
MAATTPVADQKAHKHKKDKSDKKKSKKRQREDEQPLPAAVPSSTKKLRTADTTSTPQKKSAAVTVDDSNASPFYLRTASLYLPLAAIGQAYALEAICAEHLSPLLLTYYPPLKGVVLSYHNPRLSEGPGGVSSGDRVLARSVNEFAASFVWATADFVLLRPRKGMWVDGNVNLQTESHLGLVCWNLFSASIDRRRLPDDWTWVEAGDAAAAETEDDAELEDAAVAATTAQGHFVDAQGKRVGGVISFRIRDFETSPRTQSDRGFITIEGSLLPEDKEKELDEQELEKYALRNAARKGRPRPRGGAGSGARR